MDDIDFEQQYADEFEALQDIEPTTKPRRSLHFETPKSKQVVEHIAAGSPLTNADSLLNSSQKKRVRDRGSQSDSDLEYDDEDLNTTAPATKRHKAGDSLDQLDEDELWGEDLLPTPKLPTKTLNRKSSKVPTHLEVAPEIPPSPDKRLMDRILEIRGTKSGRELTFDKEAVRNEQLVNDYDFEQQRVFKRLPATAYLATTGTEGDRVYMKLLNDSQYEHQFKNVGRTLAGGNLLGVPITVLKDQLEEQRRSQLLAESDRLSEEIRRQLDYHSDLEEEDLEGNQAPSVSEPPSGPHVKLWVDKYTPCRYTDLLSEESINRSLLHWLKMWDYVVFNKELPLKPKEKKKEENKKTFKKKPQFEVRDELDQHRRPVQKVVLLCGPPGLGKTTLAHIVAKHAGYNVVEMNASDDRSVEAFKTKIENSTQMKAVFGADPRPNCLIIDEIDGAPQAAINVLVNVIKKTEGGEEGSKKKKKEEGGLLRRPIICICNDQYVPSLRVLRQNASVLNFPQTDPTKLAGRLYEVARFEKLRSDMNTLLALCEKTDNDIRSCLNTLQFIQGRCKELNMNNIQSMTIGQKDLHKSLFSVWHDILTLPRPKRQNFVNLQESGVKDIVVNTSIAARYKNILSLVQAAGENDKLINGLFENYLHCKFKDPFMDGVSMATDWLCFNDEITQYIQHKQDYRLMPYRPYLSVTFHLLFASNSPPKIQFPHSMNDCTQKRTLHENLVTSMQADMAANIRKFINLQLIVFDILPSLINIMQPTFRPVNTQLYSAKEKADLHELVNTMISYNMTYHQEKSPEGQYNYVLDPHVDEVVKFTGMKQQKQLSYASKQLVAREIELEKMRRQEQARTALQGEITPRSSQTPSKGGKAGENKSVPSHLQRLTAKPLGKPEEIQVKDFFGRVLKKSPEAVATGSRSSGKSGAPVKKDVLATDIWFHFQGGYSNAVRRNVRIKEFM